MLYLRQSPELAAKLGPWMRERGVLISAAGPMENILKIRPLLAFEQEHAELFIDCLDKALKDVTL